MFFRCLERFFLKVSATKAMYKKGASATLNNATVSQQNGIRLLSSLTACDFFAWCSLVCSG